MLLFVRLNTCVLSMPSSHVPKFTAELCLYLSPWLKSRLFQSLSHMLLFGHLSR